MSDPHPSQIKIRVPETMTRRTREGHEIVFRQTDSPIASLGYPGEIWSIEYRRSGVAFPVAEAWVFVSPQWTYLGFLFVVEGCRRQGIGTAVFEAIKQRWPNAEFDAVTEAGKAFVNRLAESA
ncbi:MAG: hypothetical protein J0I06_02920 [Planctomycetes bacterium]|nr:hypothetical protein [Planctomycetota bacterium]